MKKCRPRASFSVFRPEVHTTNHQRFQKKVDISHNLQYLCTPNQKVYHLQHPRGIHERKHFHDPFRMRPASSRGPASPMRKARMAESVDALVSNTSGAIRAGSIPAPGTHKWPTDTCRPFLYKIFPTFSPHEGKKSSF